MIALQHVTGSVLTLKFNQEGALSTARLAGRDVTPELRGIREDNCQDVLSVFGFSLSQSAKLVEDISWLDKQFREYNYSIVRVDSVDQNNQLVHIAELKGKRFVTRPVQVTFRRCLLSNRLVEVVKITESVANRWKK